MTEYARNHYIVFLVTPKQKALIQKAARLKYSKTSPFVRAQILELSKKIIDKNK